MCYDLPRSRFVEKLLLHQLRLFYRKRLCMYISAYYNFIMSVYCLVKAIQFHIQQLDLIKLQ